MWFLYPNFRATALFIIVIGLLGAEPKAIVEVRNANGALINAEQVFLQRKDSITRVFLARENVYKKALLTDSSLVLLSKTIASEWLSMGFTKYNNVHDFLADSSDLNKIATALVDYEKFGVLPSVKIAQACLETGYGAKIRGKNYFGVKARQNEPFVSFKSREVIKGKHYLIKSRFRRYDNPWQSWRHHSQILATREHYQHLFKLKNYEEWCDGLEKYATDPNYASSLKSIIKSNKLYLLE